jgi:probable F420-dependent oxidoreductase
VHCADHLGTGWPPLAVLLATAEATTRIRVGSLVLNNDFHHPAHLAREIAAIDQLSGGRVELGLGAGHAFPEYASIGLRFDPPAVRKARLGEAVEILRDLLDGETVTWSGEHYQLDSVCTMRASQDRLPILVGVNGKTALAHAARHADAIGLTMLGRTLEDGQQHAVRWDPERIDATVTHIQEAAEGRSSPPELNALIQLVVVTDDRASVAARVADRIEGLTPAVALASPFLAFGTHEEIADHLLTCRERWGISYFSVRDIDTFAPVIDRLRRMDTDE